VKVENDVELAHIREVFVKQFHKQVNRFQVGLETEWRGDLVKVRCRPGILAIIIYLHHYTNQLIIVDIYGNSEEEPSIAPVDKLVVVELDEGSVLAVARHHQTMNFGLHLGLLFLIRSLNIPSIQS